MVCKLYLKYIYMHTDIYQQTSELQFKHIIS